MNLSPEGPLVPLVEDDRQGRRITPVAGAGRLPCRAGTQWPAGPRAGIRPASRGRRDRSQYPRDRRVRTDAPAQIGSADERDSRARRHRVWTLHAGSGLVRVAPGATRCCRSRARRRTWTPPLPHSSRSVVNAWPDTMRTKPVILLVEDFPDAREMYRDYLEFSGFEVYTAGDGHDAIAKAQRHDPDLILMDLSLPGLDGWEATRRLKADRRDRPHHDRRAERACVVGRRGARAAGRVRRLHREAVPAARSGHADDAVPPNGACRHPTIALVTTRARSSRGATFTPPIDLEHRGGRSAGRPGHRAALEAEQLRIHARGEGARQRDGPVDRRAGRRGARARRAVRRCLERARRHGAGADGHVGDRRQGGRRVDQARRGREAPPVSPRVPEPPRDAARRSTRRCRRRSCRPTAISAICRCTRRGATAPSRSADWPRRRWRSDGRASASPIIRTACRSRAA